MSTRFLSVLLLLLLAGCSQSPESTEKSPLVARLGSVELHEDDVQRAIAREPGGSAERFRDPAARRELIDGLVRFELLAQAADRAGLTKDPDAVHAMRQIAVTKLVNQTLGEVAAPESITQADIERDYLAHQASEYTLPQATRVRHVRVADAAAADALAARARALAADDDAGFAALASKSSEDSATRDTGGDLGFVDERSHLPTVIVKAATSLKTPGEISGPFQSEGGYEILRLVSLRGAIVSPLSSVQEPIRQRLYRERRTQALDAFIARLRAETPVDVVDTKSR